MIALSGYIGSGKGTAARVLVEEGYTEYSFAHSVKDVLSVVFQWPRHLLEGDTPESRKFRETVDDWWSEKLGIPSFTPRFAMKNIGTDVFRNCFHPDIWVLNTQRRIEQSDTFVVSDLRFANEHRMLKSLGVITVAVMPAKLPVWHNLAKASISGDEDASRELAECFPEVHISDYTWLSFDVDYTIYNDGTIDDLEKKVLSIIKQR